MSLASADDLSLASADDLSPLADLLPFLLRRMPVDIDKAAINELKMRLRKALEIKRLPDRHLEIVAIITEALEPHRIKPILVGGAAVEFYSCGGYVTSHIDLVAPGGRELAETMRALGFLKRGKDWVNDELELSIEYWADALGPDEEYADFQYQGLRLRILSIEDLIVDRLCQYKWWKSAIDGVNVMLLLESAIPYDDKGTIRKGKREDVYDALQGVKKLLKSLKEGRVDRSKATEMLLNLQSSFER